MTTHAFDDLTSFGAINGRRELVYRNAGTHNKYALNKYYYNDFPFAKRILAGVVKPMLTNQCLPTTFHK